MNLTDISIITTPPLDEIWHTYVDGDPFDHFPWTWEPYLDADGGPDLGSICTPNGKRSDGTSHTFWMIAGSIWKPTGIMICAAINAEAHRRYGTPNPRPADG